MRKYAIKIVNEALKSSISAYDAAYVVLAEKLSMFFVTGDNKLFNKVSPEKNFVKTLTVIWKMEIKIYSTPTCPYCQMAKKFFQENNLPFTDYNVAEDRQALEEMIGKSGQMGVPVIEIDGKIVVGFDREKIKEHVGLK